MSLLESLHIGTTWRNGRLCLQLSPPAKRARQDLETSQYLEGKSIREQAEPYRITTARFPIDCLTPLWSLGSNRPIDPQHAQDLCRIFEEEGLQRESRENRLPVTWSRDDAQKMIDHLEEVGEVSRRRGTSSWPLYKDWMLANTEMAEILSGQHRIEALKLFLDRKEKSQGLSRSGSEDNAGWWVCDIYDKGKSSIPAGYVLILPLLDKLPPALSIGLRANRDDHTMPDSHGQVWMELAVLAKMDGNIFKTITLRPKPS